jgi:nucleoside-diphosphate-sugar epimerase
MRILVIGGTRFIGPAVVRCLHAQGHTLTLFHRGQTEPAGLPDVPHLHGDRQRLADFVPTLQRLAPEVVLDLVAYTQHDAQTVMRACSGLAGRIVVTSSADVYRAYGRLKNLEPGLPDPVPLAEDAPLRASRFPDAGDVPEARDYDNILVEQVVSADPALPATILRLPAAYGPGDYQHRLFYYLKRMDDRRPAILLDDGIARWRWTRGYVENVAAAIAQAITQARASGRIYNVGEPDTLPEADWVRAIGRAAGWSGDVMVMPRQHVPLALRWWGNADTAQDLVLDTGRIRSELGYAEPVALDDALGHTVAWERAYPPADWSPAHFDYAAEDALLRLAGKAS